ncbi:MAG: integrase arm-type DNA-binding domain-containing protein [Parasphingorhabdus sp.]
MPKLTALAVRNAKPGKHGDGEGLYLIVKPSGAKSWVLRIQADGKRQDIGLGTVDTSPKTGAGSLEVDIPILQRKMLSLLEARQKAALLRGAAKSGLDPIEERDRERQKIPTFEEATIAAHSALQKGWTDKNATAFLNSLSTHAYPALAGKSVNLITSAEIITVLEPIWRDKPQIAKKVRQRITTVLNFSHSKGWRSTEAPQKSITSGLPKQPKAGHVKVMPYQEVPPWVSSLILNTPTLVRRGMLLQIYTASRHGEVRGSQWGQFDFEERLWHRPAWLMKERIAHTVTLNTSAIELLQQIRSELGGEPEPTDLLFPSRKGKMLSDDAFNKALRDAGIPYDSHGFRSSFRDWAAENVPEIPDPVAEAAISHVVADKVVRAYKRTTFIEMRRILLQKWSDYLQGSETVE